MHTTSVTLLDRVRNSLDDLAWDDFIHLYTPILYRWAVGAGENEHDAADLVQDVFAVLVDALPEFRRERKGSFRSWLRTITMNKLHDHRRRRNAVRMEQMSADQVPHWPDGVEALWEHEYSKIVGRRALELMQTDFSPTTWKACWEFVVNGRSAADVSQELGISERAVYLANFRVISRLRRDLNGLLD